MAFRKKARSEESVNPTPLVDVMFNLLIFIIVTAQYSNIQALKVNLPRAESGQAIEKVERVVISLTREGQIFFDGSPSNQTALRERLAPLAKKEPQPAIFIQADEGSTTGTLVTVMDLTSKAGLKKVSIETRK